MQYPHAYTSSSTLYYIIIWVLLVKAKQYHSAGLHWPLLKPGLFTVREALLVSFSNWIHSNFKLHFHILLTSACCVDSNIYGLGKIHCIKYLTMVDSCHSTSPAMHKYYHLTSGSVEVPQCTCTENSSSIGEEPVPYCSPDFTSSIRRSATSSFVSYAEQGICTFTNVLQGD